MLMYQKSIFDRYYCIQHFFRLKSLEKFFKKFFLPVPIRAWKSMLPANVLKMLPPGQKLMSLLLCTLLMKTLVFMMARESLFVKLQSRALIAREFPY